MGHKDYNSNYGPPQWQGECGGTGGSPTNSLCQFSRPAEVAGTGTQRRVDGTETHKKERAQRGGKKKTRKLGEGIFNLADIVFTQEELLVLDKGIKYAPSKSFNQFKAFIDLHKFVRKLI